MVVVPDSAQRYSDAGGSGGTDSGLSLASADSAFFVTSNPSSVARRFNCRSSRPRTKWYTMTFPAGR